MGRFSKLELSGQRQPFEEAEPPGERDESYYLDLATRKHRSGHYEAALRYYARTLEYNPNLPAPWLGQVQALIELGELKEAKLWADKALEVHRDQPELLSAKAVACARLGDITRAMAYSDAALSKQGNTSYLWIARGEALLAADQGTDEYCFVKARSAPDADWFTVLEIAKVHYSYAEYAKALEWAEQARARDAKRALVWCVLGKCQQALGMYADAERSLRQAISLDRSCEEAEYALTALRRRGPVRRLLAWLRDRFR
ncbi:tetratricopeptide repeat protein [Planctomycetota bacterium]